MMMMIKERKVVNGKVRASFLDGSPGDRLPSPRARWRAGSPERARPNATLIPAEPLRILEPPNLKYSGLAMPMFQPQKPTNAVVPLQANINQERGNGSWTKQLLRGTESHRPFFFT